MTDVPPAAVEAANEAFWNAAGIRPPLALEATLAAAAPLIRQATADEIAAEIEKLRKANQPSQLPDHSEADHAYYGGLGDALRIARRVGGGGGGGQ